jgi:hypothetical protein
MSSKISEIPVLLRVGALAALAGLAAASLEFGGAAQGRARAFPSPLDRPLPPGLTWFSLAAALGNQARVAADVGYIDCLQYMGGPNINDGFFAKTLPLYREVQWLDPSFRHAIMEGISVLGWLYRRPMEAEVLARAALAADHRDVETHYGVYIAALAYQKHLDSAGALSVLEPEVLRPDAPDMLLRAVGNLIIQQREWPRALAYWTWMRSRAHDQDTLEMVARTLPLIRRHLASGLPAAPAPIRHTD